MEFLENRSIFVMGATGFLGKIMVEKILRVQPNVKKLYLLIRSADEITATHCFYNEVVEKDLFRVLREKWGGKMNSLISEKICLVSGNISSPNLGLKDSNLLKEMKDQMEIIVTLAATTKFDERYDVAFGTNTLGAKHVLSFAKQCSNLEVVVHVSTGEKEGLILDFVVKFNFVMQLVELYRQYLYVKATFDDTNTERLRIAARNSDLEDIFYFDPRVINWTDYFFNVHIPALVKYVIK